MPAGTWSPVQEAGPKKSIMNPRSLRDNTESAQTEEESGPS